MIIYYNLLFEKLIIKKTCLSVNLYYTILYIKYVSNISNLPLSESRLL